MVQRAIVLAEDDPAIRLSLEMMMRKAQYRVMTAKDGAQALELCKSELPDAILCDIYMPVMDGYQVCEALRADETTRDIHIMLVSGAEQDEVMVRALEVGAEFFIPKPCDPKDVAVDLYWLFENNWHVKPGVKMRVTKPVVKMVKLESSGEPLAEDEPSVKTSSLSDEPSHAPQSSTEKESEKQAVESAPQRKRIGPAPKVGGEPLLQRANKSGAEGAGGELPMHLHSQIHNEIKTVRNLIATLKLSAVRLEKALEEAESFTQQRAPAGSAPSAEVVSAQQPPRPNKPAQPSRIKVPGFDQVAQAVIESEEKNLPQQSQ